MPGLINQAYLKAGFSPVQIRAHHPNHSTVLTIKRGAFYSCEGVETFPRASKIMLHGNVTRYAELDGVTSSVIPSWRPDCGDEAAVVRVLAHNLGSGGRMELVNLKGETNADQS